MCSVHFVSRAHPLLCFKGGTSFFRRERERESERPTSAPTEYRRSRRRGESERLARARTKRNDGGGGGCKTYGARADGTIGAS